VGEWRKIPGPDAPLAKILREDQIHGVIALVARRRSCSQRSSSAEDERGRGIFKFQMDFAIERIGKDGLFRKKFFGECIRPSEGCPWRSRRHHNGTKESEVRRVEVQSNDKVLEIGFGPGVGIELLAQAAAGGYVFGIDPSKEMLDQAASRNARAIESGHVDLRLGSAEALPFKDNSFDKAMAINSLHMWSDAIAGLREVRRVMKPGGRIACGFTRNSGQRKDGLIEKFCAAGFTNVRLAETDQDFCVLAVKP
jgi:SAM-dependent methyltransferase